MSRKNDDNFTRDDNMQLLKANVAFVKILALEWNQLASVLLDCHFGLLSKRRVRLWDDNWTIVQVVALFQRVEELAAISERRALRSITKEKMSSSNLLEYSSQSCQSHDQKAEEQFLWAHRRFLVIKKVEQYQFKSPNFNFESIDYFADSIKFHSFLAPFPVWLVPRNAHDRQVKRFIAFDRLEFRIKIDL